MIKRERQNLEPAEIHKRRAEGARMVTPRGCKLGEKILKNEVELE